MTDRMIIDYPGHRYRIPNLDGDKLQIIEFVQREPHHEPRPGIIIQDLLRICIDRVKTLNEEVQASENEQVLFHLRMAMVYQETRALRRKVELRKIYPEELACGEDGHFKLSWSEEDTPNAS